MALTTAFIAFVMVSYNCIIDLHVTCFSTFLSDFATLNLYMFFYFVNIKCDRIIQKEEREREKKKKRKKQQIIHKRRNYGRYERSQGYDDSEETY